jgi:8-hydroxy-5-deazaflavin:NADPH oxidoreductase
MLSVAAAHRVVPGDSGGPEAAADLVAELGSLASAATGDHAAESGDIVLVRTPLGAH